MKHRRQENNINVLKRNLNTEFYIQFKCPSETKVYYRYFQIKKTKIQKNAGSLVWMEEI